MRLRPTTAGGSAAAWAAAASLAVAPIAGYEGMRNAAYQDVAKIWTICAGETQGVKPGDWKSTKECNTMLARRVHEHAMGMAACTYVAVPQVSIVALISFGYNVGVGAYCKSTLARKLNAGDLAGACAELSRWDKAAGIRWPGLTKRRAAERHDCELGVA